ncbi:MAG: PEP-CTERM sorting domain-containing protein [Cyanobacteria bacterium P01_D01_bin.71]
MGNMFFKAAIAGTAATLSVITLNLEAAQAITFNLGGFPTVSSSFFLQEDGIGLTINGSDENGNSRSVARGPNGVGVFLDGSADDFETDGFGPDETLNLLFDSTVDLISATFSRVGFNDDFRLFVDGSATVDADIPGGNIFDFGIGTFDFTPFETIGDQFGFTVIGFNDDFFLKSVEVEKVPEPALMLGLGAVAAGLLAQKRSRKETV